MGNQPENELNLFGRPENLVGAADRMGSHSYRSKQLLGRQLTGAPLGSPRGAPLFLASCFAALRDVMLEPLDERLSSCIVPVGGIMRGF